MQSFQVVLVGLIDRKVSRCRVFFLRIGHEILRGQREDLAQVVHQQQDPLAEGLGTQMMDQISVLCIRKDTGFACSLQFRTEGFHPFR